jgi:hypothetical protein
MENQQQTPPRVAVSGDQAAVAAAIVGGLVLLAVIRRGAKVGPVQLTGSAVGAAEWLGYALVVGGTMRTAATLWPDNGFVRAVNGFIL